MPEKEAAEESGLDWLQIVATEIVTWFTARWHACCGPRYYSPAYIFFHGGLETPRYDMEKRAWLLSARYGPMANLVASAA